MATDTTIRSYDPLAYFVNNVSELDHEVVKAHKNKDAEKTRELLSRAKLDYNVYICINTHNHAFVLCAPNGSIDPSHPLSSAIDEDPLHIPESLLCWRFELCFENEELRMYKIRKEFAMFKDIVRKISKSYFIGTYQAVAAMALQFAALKSAPHRYNAILSDCVEFSKEYCVSLLSYCNNWKTLEEQVNNRIKEASATGLSLEKLSRKYRSAGIVGGLSLQGPDVTTYFAGRRSLLLVIAILLIYPIIIAVVVAIIFKYF